MTYPPVRWSSVRRQRPGAATMPTLVSRRSNLPDSTPAAGPPFVALPCSAHKAPDYEGAFNRAHQPLHEEQRYRVFADIDRRAKTFPQAIWHSPEGRREIVL